MRWSFDGQEYVVELLSKAEAHKVGAETEWWSSYPDFPLHQRSIWPSVRGPEAWRMLRIVPSKKQESTICVGLLVNQLRALPGSLYIRVPKFGVGLDRKMSTIALAALRHIAWRWKRVVRVRIEVTQLERPEDLELICGRAIQLGYWSQSPLEYEFTLISPIPYSVEDGARQFHRSVLKNVRKSVNAGHIVRALTDPRYAERMGTLYNETMERTGAELCAVDMKEVLRSAKNFPESFRVSGLFQRGEGEPESLMAFRWCGVSGQFGYDLLAASTRVEEAGGSIPMMPSIILDVFSWAHSLGARQFDFGGVVHENHPQYSVVGGISRFKLQFGGVVERVGCDLVFEPRPWLAQLTGLLSRAAKLLNQKKKGSA
ncbi:MAG: hypothetical protein IBJ03_01345 [Gemmatimonadaceae bacterium]|nr:hypothetical protein [Gemmatimonadaceae bacterium]